MIYLNKDLIIMIIFEFFIIYIKKLKDFLKLNYLIKFFLNESNILNLLSKLIDKIIVTRQFTSIIFFLIIKLHR